jgi:hypothetical protein
VSGAHRPDARWLTGLCIRLRLCFVNIPSGHDRSENLELGHPIRLILKAAVESPLNRSSSSNRRWLQQLTISPFWRGAEQFEGIDRGESEQVSCLTPAFPQGLKPTSIFSHLRPD